VRIFLILYEAAVNSMLSLLRVRQELEKVIEKYTSQISDAIAKGTTQTMFYEIILQGLNVSSF